MEEYCPLKFWFFSKLLQTRKLNKSEIFHFAVQWNSRDDSNWKTKALKLRTIGYLNIWFLSTATLPQLKSAAASHFRNCLHARPHFKPKHVRTGRCSCPIPNIPPNEAMKSSLSLLHISAPKEFTKLHLNFWTINWDSGS